ncbi:fimbrial protein [Achromobacter xylosoxidans]
MSIFSLSVFGRLQSLGVAAAALLSVICFDAKAAIPGCDDRFESYTLPLPAAVVVARDSPVGTPITPWIESPIVEYIRCGGAPPAERAQQAWRLNMTLSQTSGRYSEAGLNYVIYATGVPGVGVVADSSGPYNGQCSFPRLSASPSGTTYQRANSHYCTQSSSFNGGVRIRLIKTGAVQNGVMPPMVFGQVQTMRSRDQRLSIFQAGNFIFGNRFTYGFGSTQIVGLTCTTSDVDVNMRTHLVSAFSGNGAVSPAQAFQIRMLNCPAGLRSIQYRIDPTTAVVPGMPGTVTLQGANAARGIGLQLLDASNRAVQLGQWLSYTQYNSATGGSYDISLRARYIRTGGAVQPGEANVRMTFTMNYQ